MIFLKPKNSVILILLIGGLFVFSCKQKDVSTNNNERTSVSSDTLAKDISPIYLVNDSIVDKAYIDSLPADTIGNIEMIDASQAERRFGEKGKNGAVLITLNPVKEK